MLSKFTIFQKMLIAPLLAIGLFSLFILNIHNQQIVSKNYMDSIQNSHFPILRISNENLILLDNTTRVFQDSVGAQEKEWLKNTYIYKVNIQNNIKTLKSLNIDEKILDNINKTFESYFNTTMKLSILMIEQSDKYDEIESLTNLMATRLNKTKKLFSDFKVNENINFKNTIKTTNLHTEKLFWLGVIIGGISFILIVFITLFLSLGTKKSLNDLLVSIKSFADGNPDFTKRLDEQVEGELGSLSKQFNRFTQKLELDYNKLSNALISLDIEKQKSETLYKHTKDSIAYASLIQRAILPEKSSMNLFFNDSFLIWEPKDTVGGDIYLLETINRNECLIYCIDCTGHGVPGAFVTMLVKAIQVQINGLIENNNFIEINTSWIMSYFNKTIKKLLKQTNKDSVSNAGFDGGIIYYNKEMKLLKFSGANTSLFYVDQEENLQTVKGDKYSVGYKKCDYDYEYKNIEINVEENMKFYITTDGYIDQNGGTKDFPFGKTKFTNIIKENHNKPMQIQKDIFNEKLLNYENQIINNDRNDDVTVIAFKI